MIYRKHPTKNGVRYTKDARFIKKDNINPHVLEKLETEDEVSDQGRYCLFCGKPTTWTRLYNSTLIYLCKKHYHEVSLGKIAEKLRNLNGDQAGN